jgi:hypothetical protein
VITASHSTPREHLNTLPFPLVEYPGFLSVLVPQPPLHEDLDDYLDVIRKLVEFIGPETASLSVPWTKFLLHGVPTRLDLEVIRHDVEGYCSGAKLGQTPR